MSTQGETVDVSVRRFRKKPVVVEAVRWTGENIPEILAFAGDDERVLRLGDGPGAIGIVTLEGTMFAYPGDWIIKDIKNELYPCKSEIFLATYEAVENQDVQGLWQEEAP